MSELEETRIHHCNASICEVWQFFYPLPDCRQEHGLSLMLPDLQRSSENEMSHCPLRSSVTSLKASALEVAEFHCIILQLYIQKLSCDNEPGHTADLDWPYGILRLFATGPSKLAQMLLVIVSLRVEESKLAAVLGWQ